MRTLWRSRRTGGTWARRALRRALRGLAAAVVIWAVMLQIAIAIVATHKARSPFAAIDVGAPHEAVTLITSDGFQLAGSYVPSRNGPR